MNRVMKDSGIEWIGEIPRNWNVERLKYHACFNPNTDLPDLSDNDVVSFVPMDRLKTGFHLQAESVYSRAKKGYVVFREEDILMAKVTPCLENGNLAIASNLINGIGFGSTEINVIRCFSISNKYLFYLLQCPSYIEKASYNMFGVAGLKRLDPKFIPYSFFPFPPHEDQLRISEYLDNKCAEIDSLIASKEKINTLLKDWRQSIIYEAVTKGLDPNVPLKNSGIEWIGKIPASWSTAPLRSKFSFGKGLTITKSDLADDGFCVISYGQIHSKDNVGVCVNDSLVKYISKSHKSLVDSAKTNVGDFIFADTSEDIQGCGNNVYIDRDDCIYAGYHTLILRSKNSRQNKYYAYLFSSDAWRAQVRARVSGVKLYSITQGILKSTTLIVPPPSEQDRIIEYLDAKCNKIDLAITQNNVTIQQLKEYRQSLICEAVTGKICINEMEKK